MQNLGENHISIANIFNNLSVLYFKKELFNKSEIL